MTYFKNITTLEELRKEYKKLVKQNHPDNGGSAEVIKVINVEYEIQFKTLEKEVTRSHGKTTMADIRIKYGSDVVKEANTVFCVTA